MTGQNEPNKKPAAMDARNEPKSLTLDVLIATHGEDGLERVASMSLPRVEGVRYVVAWQNRRPEARDKQHGELVAADFFPVDLPQALRRDDLAIFPNHTFGLGCNRNESIAHASADLCLIADNDLDYTESQLRSVIDYFAANPSAELVTFKYADAKKAYPDSAVVLSARLPKGYYVTSFEIAFRRKAVAGKVAFDPRFGVGAEYGCAEEAIFLHDCIEAGITCSFCPVVVTTHRGATTGNRPFANRGIPRAEGYHIKRVYGLAGLLRLPLFAWRSARAGRMAFAPCLANLLYGFIFIRKPKSESQSTHNQ